MQPFVTQNKQLAHALAVAGCRFAESEDGGPVMNTYTPGFLRDRRLIGNNPISIREFERAAEDAAAKRIPGIVTYFFERDDVFYRAEAAWQKMCEEISNAKIERRAPALPDISEEVVAQIMCIAAHGLKAINDAPFLTVPWVSTIAGAESFDEDTRARSFAGSGKAWPLNISAEGRKKLNI